MSKLSELSLICKGHLEKPSDPFVYIKGNLEELCELVKSGKIQIPQDDQITINKIYDEYPNKNHFPTDHTITGKIEYLSSRVHHLSQEDRKALLTISDKLVRKQTDKNVQGNQK